MPTKNHLLLGTRKGLIIYQFKNDQWVYKALHFKGIPVSIAWVDERDQTIWACLDHGHWGCKLHCSTDSGASWQEVAPPKYPEGEEVKEGVAAATRYIWAMNHGGRDQAERLWLGTEPGGLFVRKHKGEDFQLIPSLWNDPSRKDHWFGGGRDYAGIHSIVVDPRDSNHLYVGISCAGVFESRDGGMSWAARNKGLKADYLPDPYAEVGHDPHLLLACPSDPDVLWQQNHCGIFRSTDGGQQWTDISEEEGPAKFGFTIAVSEENTETAWVVPAISDEIRIAPQQALCVCRTDDGGKSWTSFRKGLPQEACFDIVYRHALDVNGEWLCFGTTTGNLFLSADYGATWKGLNHHLPMVYDVHFAQF